MFSFFLLHSMLLDSLSAVITVCRDHPYLNLCLQWKWFWYSDRQYKYLYWYISKPMPKRPKIKGLYPDTWRMWCLSSGINSPISSGINNVLSHVSLVSTLDITVKMACTISTTTPDTHELQCIIIIIIISWIYHLLQFCHRCYHQNLT